MPKRKPDRSTNGENNHGKRKRQEEEEDEDEEEMEMEETRTKVQEAEVGIVERIILKNFMCHGLLDVKLGPHVNFIIGRNGSGKSAVVTGLVVGMGGLASTTNRGSKVRSFVKSGKHTAEVEITLRNRGPDSYRHDVYGDLIRIQRKISADGGTKYTIKSAGGRLVSDKLEEVKKIKDFFNIQVENPVAVLNQDTSRNFLHTKNPSDKYKFFLKATQLEQMKEQYDEAIASKDKTVFGIQQYEKTLPALRHEVDKWEEKFKNLGTISDLKEKVKKLKHEMAWAFVVEKEKSLEPEQKRLKSEEARLPKFMQKATESKAKLEQSQAQLKAVQARLLAVTEETERLKPALKEKRDMLNAAKAALRGAQNDSRNVEREIRNVTSERQQIQERIKELQQSAQHNYEAERLQRQEKMKSVEEQLRAAESRQRTTQHEREQFQAAVSKYKNESYNVTRDERAKQTEKDNSERNLQTLMSARENRFKRFGSWVPSAMAKINEWCRQGKFHKKPRGPLGGCFQLKDQSWAVAVECCLRALIHSFVCHDHHDEKLLEQIFQQELGNRRRPAIITCPFKDVVHDVSRYRVRGSNYPCVLDMIECDDPVVLNALIDQRGIENVILIADPGEARNVMLHRPPTNCKDAFTRDGDHLYCLPMFRYYSSENNSARFLTSNVEEEIQVSRGIVQRLDQELRELQQQRQTLQKQVSSNQREEKRCETQHMKITETVNNLKYELNELRSIEDPVPVDITTLEEDVQNYSQQIALLEERKVQVSDRLKEKQETCRAAEREFQEIEAEAEARANSDNPLRDELNSAQMALDEAQQHKKHYQDQLKEQEASIAKLRKRANALKKEVEDDTRKALQICAERIHTQRTPSEVEREVNQINIRIRQEEETQGDPVEITHRYQETKTRYMEIQKEVKSFRKFIQKLEDALQKRAAAYVHFTRLLGHRLVKCFHSCLAMRHFTGSIKLCHRQKTLNLLVAPTEDSEVNNDLKSLSGGERSFSTVCFILSLWNAMESPFRCLDEFDVYMDLVNRRISMDMMLQMTRNQTNKQFIFLTPQDMSQLSSSVVGRPRIFQMPDPDRAKGQTRLDFGKQGRAGDGDDED
ncbi:structural maintenance of chromosomes protein 6-like isoform X2 [Babylonia areolata]|uniref:structural maintenance of chromosomes protein 6-like isoform X2 n=1 Tax=Babylonia areolata TaxID=304850 RepID=UPI003FCFA170